MSLPPFAGGFDLIIRAATVQTASDSFVADIGVRDGRISALGELGDAAARIVEARGLVALPGGIDAHTHFDMPWGVGVTADDFCSGTVSALFGGTTTVIDFATQRRGGSLMAALDDWRSRAGGRCLTDYAFHMAITDLSSKTEAEMARLVREGVTSFKLYMAYPGALMSDAAAILRALRRSNEIGGLVSLHCEDGLAIAELTRQALAQGRAGPASHPRTRPPACEESAVRQAAALAETAAAPVYIVHISTAGSLEAVRQARRRGAMVLAETCPQYLYLTDHEYGRPGFAAARFVMSPPLRPKGHGEALWQGLASGEFQTVASDHCAFRMASSRGRPGKDLGRKDFSRIPNGAPGVETRLPLLWEAVQSGRISASRFVELTATGPAKIFGLYPRKGHLSPGADADIVLIDPKKRTLISARSQHSQAGYTPYEGITAHGAITDVFVRGTRMISQGRLLGKPGHGRFLPRSQRQFCL